MITVVLVGAGNRANVYASVSLEYPEKMSEEYQRLISDMDEPTKRELKLDDPQYKYINSAVFFYKKLSELSETELNEFVNYIFYSTNIIKIEFTNQSFAIKLFQVLNDRGLELSPSDIIKSYIIGKYEQDDETGKQILRFSIPSLCLFQFQQCRPSEACNSLPQAYRLP